jgi:hypothetical protein
VSQKRKFAWQQSPLAACPQEVIDGLEDSAKVGGARSPDWPLRRQKRADKGPSRSFGSKWQTEHAFVMPRDPLKIRGVFQLERLAMVPRVFEGRQCPEVAFGIQYNPVPIGSVREECWYVLPNRFVHRIPLLHKMRFSSTENPRAPSRA